MLAVNTNEYAPERVALDLRQHGFAIIDNFLLLDEVAEIVNQIEEKLDNGEFKKAGIGKAEDYQIQHGVRGDLIRWIDQNEAIPTNLIFLPRIKVVTQDLNKYCFLGLVDFEYHHTHYPVGSKYAKHTDTFKNDNSRVISAVCYLNVNWIKADGGELLIYDEGADGTTIEHEIEPRCGRLVIFESRLWHEVLECREERRSITGWFHNQRNLF
ncbi:MAG: 2OG-Fe(II) oxygenase [Cyclobacteriaceae bacterium]